MCGCFVAVLSYKKFDDYDWRWLDDVSPADFAAADISISAEPPPRLRQEHAAMLAFGYKYTAAYITRPIAARGLKFAALANAVATGFPRGGERLSYAEQTQRVRAIMRGELQPLWQELTEAAQALQAMEAEARRQPPPSPDADANAPDATAAHSAHRTAAHRRLRRQCQEAA